MKRLPLNPDYFIRVTSNHGTTDYVPCGNYDRAVKMADYYLSSGVATQATVNHSFSRRVLYTAKAPEPANDSWLPLSVIANSILAKFR